MKKLILYIDKEDDDLKPGGALADKIWKVNSIAIIVMSGYSQNSYTYNGTRKPYLTVGSAEKPWEPADFRKEFDLAAFEKALAEAKVELARMEGYLAQCFYDLVKAG